MLARTRMSSAAGDAAGRMVQRRAPVSAPSHHKQPKPLNHQRRVHDYREPVSHLRAPQQSERQSTRLLHIMRPRWVPICGLAQRQKRMFIARKGDVDRTGLSRMPEGKGQGEEVTANDSVARGPARAEALAPPRVVGEHPPRGSIPHP